MLGFAWPSWLATCRPETPSLSSHVATVLRKVCPTAHSNPAASNGCRRGLIGNLLAVETGEDAMTKILEELRKLAAGVQELRAEVAAIRDGNCDPPKGQSSRLKW
jgi:hypothetical protein